MGVAMSSTQEDIEWVIEEDLPFPENVFIVA
jgi:hypothetical protein